MRAVDQWAAVQEGLPEDWSEARIVFKPEGAVDRAATILAPLGPGRVADELRIHVVKKAGLERVRNVLRRLDERRIWGILELVDVTATPEAAVQAPVAATQSLVSWWEDVLAELPPDWSDALCELELDSSDHVPRAALLGAPLNPTRVPGAIALRFRASNGGGYGTSPQMVRRCLERMDAAGITGRIRVVLDLSQTDNAVTQGPVWRIAGRSV